MIPRAMVTVYVRPDDLKRHQQADSLAVALFVRAYEAIRREVGHDRVVAITVSVEV